MKKYLLQLVLAFVLTTVSLLAHAQVSSMTGNWTTINDKTKKPQAIVNIAKALDGFYYGKICGLYDANGCMMEAPYPEEVKKFIGMTVLIELKPCGKELKGKALDPGSGKIYHGKAIYDAQSDRLVLRGSIDKWAILGRSQTWIRYKK